LETQEDEELWAVLKAARSEWEADGGVEADEFFRDLKASSAQ